MSTVISVQSFRHGAGRSSLVANLAYLLARNGQRVCAFDTHFHSPGLHLFLGLSDDEIEASLTGYLLGRNQLDQALRDLSARLELPVPGRLFLLPASPSVRDILPMLSHKYDLEKLDEAIDQLEQELELDVIVLDAPPGLNQDTMLTIAFSSFLVIVLRPDPQDFQGTAVMIDVARRLGETRIFLALNDIPAALDEAQARQEIERTYGCPVGALLPYSEALVELASDGLLARSHPQDPYVLSLEQLAGQI